MTIYRHHHGEFLWKITVDGKVYAYRGIKLKWVSTDLVPSNLIHSPIIQESDYKYFTPILDDLKLRFYKELLE